MRKELSERFWSKVDVRTAMECWLWQAGTSRGYGLFRLNGKLLPAHRVAYESTRGPIPKGLTLDHLCRNRACVNPLHLEAVTHRMNVLRGNGIAAREARTTACPQGHSYSGDNLGIEPTGRRYCKECKRMRRKEK